MTASALRSHPLVAELLTRTRFPEPGTAVTCGVSGGADSTALAALAVAADCVVECVHVDHGLRPGSAAEAEVVAETASAIGATFRSERVEVGDGPDLEARARAARHAVLGPDALLGHTADDQAETVLLALLRGSGPTGLAGIPPDRRPLLDLRRSDTEAVCRALGLRWVDDESNRDPRFRRNRVRHELIPAMCDVAGRDVVPLLVRAAGHQRDAVEALDLLAQDLDPTDAAALRDAPRGIATTAVRRWWRDETGSAYAPDAAAVERILAVAALEAEAAEVLGGWRVERSGGRLRLVRPAGSGHDGRQ